MWVDTVQVIPLGKLNRKDQHYPHKVGSRARSLCWRCSVDLHSRGESPTLIALCYRESPRGTKLVKRFTNYLGTNLDLGANSSKELSGKANCPIPMDLGKSYLIQLVEGKKPRILWETEPDAVSPVGIGEIPESSLSRQSSRVSHIMQCMQSGRGEWKTTEILQLSFISLNPTVCVGQIHCLTLQTSSFSL